MQTSRKDELMSLILNIITLMNLLLKMGKMAVNEQVKAID